MTQKKKRKYVKKKKIQLGKIFAFIQQFSIVVFVTLSHARATYFMHFLISISTGSIPYSLKLSKALTRFCRYSFRYCA
jgi:hypothetical protein